MEHFGQTSLILVTINGEYDIVESLLNDGANNDEYYLGKIVCFRTWSQELLLNKYDHYIDDINISMIEASKEGHFKIFMYV
jgi:hypothetical protein